MLQDDACTDGKMADHLQGSASNVLCNMLHEIAFVWCIRSIYEFDARLESKKSTIC